MKSILFVLLALFWVSHAFAQTQVDGYYRKDGTYVAPHYRSSSDSTVKDNYSYKGNSNPYTGEQGTNYYKKSSTSDYYDPSGWSGSSGSRTKSSGLYR
jgi:hypothetical protein